MKYKVFVLLFFVGMYSKSQSLTFVLDRNKTCVGTQVNVILATTSGVSGIGIDYFGQPSSIQGQPFKPSFIYPQPGIFNVIVLYNTTLSASSFLFPSVGSPPISVEVKDTVPVVPLNAKDNSIEAFGCSGNKGRVTINRVVYDFYQIDWGDGSPQDIITASGARFKDHSYANTNPRTIKVFGRINQTPTGTTCGPNLPFTKTIFPSAQLEKAIPIQLEVITQTDGNIGSIAYAFNPVNAAMRYYLYQKIGIAGNYTANALDTIEFQSQNVLLSINGLNTSTNRYCYKVAAFDGCETPQKESDEICSTIITAKATTSGNDVSWESYQANNVKYELSGNGMIINSQNKTTPSPSPIIYNDENVRCKQNYCYKSVSTFGVSSYKSISASGCVVGIKRSTIAGVNNLNSSFENEGLKISWEASTFVGINYRIYTSNEKLDTVLFYLTDKTENIVSSNNAPCYAVKIKEACGESPMRFTCPIQIAANKDNQIQNTVKWTGTYVNGDLIPINSYTLEQYNENQQLLKSEPQGLNLAYIHNPIDTTNQKILYKIKATLANGSVVFSDYAEVIQDVRIFVPDAFTPNGDGLNDVFEVKGLFWEKYEIAIYNRWGQVVFATNDRKKSWDGGSYIPGLYHVVAKVTDKYGKSQTWKNTITLIKN